MSLKVKNIVLNEESYLVLVGGKRKILFPGEFKMLKLLMKKVDSVVSVDEIAEITGLNNKKGSCIRVYAHSLRQRIGPGLIETVKGRGYILRSANY